MGLFWSLPTNEDKWLRFEPPSWEANKSRAKMIFGWTELNLVKFGVAGMPLRWKIFNIIAVFCPKLVLWVFLVSLGFNFLLESSGIINVIMNSLALTFILSLDELIFEVLTTVPVKHIMENLEEFALYNIANDEEETEHEVIHRFNEKEIRSRLWQAITILVPRRFLSVCILTYVFIWMYYANNCERSSDGGLVSKPMY